jgi:hypothetical protein
MKILSFVAGLFHAEKWKDRHTTDLIVTLRNFTIKTKNSTEESFYNENSSIERPCLEHSVQFQSTYQHNHVMVQEE